MLANYLIFMGNKQPFSQSMNAANSMAFKGMKIHLRNDHRAFYLLWEVGLNCGEAPSFSLV